MSFLASLVLLVTLALLNDVTWWHPVLLIIMLHLIYLLLRMGRITLHLRDGIPSITIQSLSLKLLITGPYKYAAWWSYDYGESSADDSPDDHKIGSRANDILVILQLTSEQGGHLCFVERIAFDTRFPNEVPHSEQGLKPCSTRVRLQRADRLLRFLQKHLEPAVFKNDHL